MPDFVDLEGLVGHSSYSAVEVDPLPAVKLDCHFDLRLVIH